MLSLFHSSPFRYQALPTSEQRSQERSIPFYYCRQLLLAIAFAIVFMLIGLFVGRRSLPGSRDGLLLPYGSRTEIWHHNLTFSMKPTPESEKAWSSLMPEGRGFVHHPEIAPYMNSIAVFHQLHCLHGIRVAYYTMMYRLEKLNGSGVSDSYLEWKGARSNIPHLQHCFDYLRRSLICAADTNLEVVNPQTESTTGWGFERQCRDYESVMEWAYKWRNSSEVGII